MLSGKEIVIYQFSSNPKLNWNALINTIESQLIEKGIRPVDMPCYRAASDKGKVKEMTTKPEPSTIRSQYFYYENDEFTLKDIKKMEQGTPGFLSPFHGITIASAHHTNSTIVPLENEDNSSTP